MCWNVIFAVATVCTYYMFWQQVATERKRKLLGLPRSVHQSSMKPFQNMSDLTRQLPHHITRHVSDPVIRQLPPAEFVSALSGSRLTVPCCILFTRTASECCYTS
jgi:hypothetical protein